jgi:uncharacterized protein (DUF3820 family)
VEKLYTAHINIDEHNKAPDLSKTLPPLTDDDCLGFGQYTITKLKDVPIKYLQWMVECSREYPRVARPTRWNMVLEWIKSKKDSK